MTGNIRNYAKRLIDVVVEMVNNEETHWSDDWDKAEYRIVKRFNDSGATSYMPQRKLKKDWEKLINVTFACVTEDEARYKIELDKQFYREAWLREKTEHIEIIKVA